MRFAEKICNGIGLVSEWSGRAGRFLIIPIIISVTYEVTARYIFNAPTIWSFTLSYMLGGTLAAIGLAYVYYHRANVRVDVIYTRFSSKGKLIIDIVFTLIFFFPLYFIAVWVMGQYTSYAYSTHQIAFETPWRPILWPFKAIVTLGFGLVCLQGLATFVKDVMSLVKAGKEPW